MNASGDVVDADILTIDDLKTRFPFNVLFGVSVLIVSEALARDPVRCAEVATLFKNAYTNSIFRHFVVANGVGVDELRARPELKHFFENVMVRDAAHIGEIEAEIRSFAQEGWPSEQHLTGFIWSAVLTFFGGLFSLMLVFLNFASRLSLVAGVMLAVIWYGGWTAEWARPVSVFCAYFAGYNLNFVQPYELWSWLGRRWKLPSGVGLGTRRLTAVSTLVPSGGLIFWGGCVIAAFLLARPDQNLALAAFVAGIVGQVAVDQIVLRAGRQSGEIAGSAAQALATIPQNRQSTTHIDLASVNRAASTAAIAAHAGLYVLMFSIAVRIGPAGLIVGANPEELWSWIVAPAIAGFATLTLFAPARLSLPAFSAARGMTGAQTSRIRVATQVKKGAATPRPLPEDAAAIERFAPEERAEVMRWLESLRGGRLAPFRPWLTPRDYVFISYAWAGEIKAPIAGSIAGACASAGIKFFLDKQGVESPSGIYRVFLGRGLARATHVLAVITPETLQGTVVLTEIETAMQRWPLERSPAIICVVEPDVVEALRADPAVPLSLRILLNFCPQVSVAEGAEPSIVRYMLEWTRRPGRIGDWVFLLSPATALARAVSLDGVAAPEAAPKTG